MSVAHSLPKALQEALVDSENLVVLCSPAAAASQWVNDEITFFRDRFGTECIWPIIVDGSPPKCFPPALLELLPEPYAPDVRDFGDGFENAALKLAAGLLKIDFAVLKDRESARLRKRARLNAALAATFAVMALGAAFAAWKAIEASAIAEAERDRAIRAATEAKGRQLAAEADIALREGLGLDGAERAAALSIEAWRRAETLTAFNVASKSLARLPIAMTTKENMSAPLVFSPDAAHLAVAGIDGRVRVYTASTLSEKFSHESPTHGPIQFSPDSNRLATCGGALCEIVDVATGSTLETISVRHPVSAITFGEGGELLAASSGDEETQIVSLNQGDEKNLLSIGAAIRKLTFSRGNKALLVTSDHSKVRAIDSQTGQVVREIYLGENMRQAIISPNLSYIGTVDGSTFPVDMKSIVNLTSINTGNQFNQIRHKDAVDYISFSGDGERVAVGSQLGTIKVAMSRSSEVLAEFDLGEPLFALALSDDGTRLVTLSFGESDTLRLFDVADPSQSGLQVGSIDPSPEEGLLEYNFSSSGNYIAYNGEYEGTAWVIDVDETKLVAELPESTDVVAIAVSSAGDRMATGSASGDVRIHNLQDSAEIESFRHRGLVDIVAFSPDNELLLSATSSGEVRVVNAATGEETLRFHSEDAIVAAAFMNDSRNVIALSRNGLLTTMGSNGNEASMSIESEFSSMAVSPDGEHIALGGSDGVVRIVRVMDLKIVSSTHQTERPITFIAFSSDSRSLAFSGLDGQTVWLFDGDLGRQRAQIEHSERIESLGFSPDGRTFASASADGVMKLTSVETGSEVARIGSAGWLRSMAFTPDGFRLAAINQDGQLSVYSAQPESVFPRLCTEREGRNLTHEEWRRHVGLVSEWRATCESWR